MTLNGKKADTTENTFTLMKLYLESGFFGVCVCESERVCVCIRRWAACFSQASLWFYEYIAIVAYSVFFHFFSLIRSLALLCVNQAESTTVTIQFVLNLLYRIVVRGCKNIFLVVLFAAVALLCCTFILTLDS